MRRGVGDILCAVEDGRARSAGLPAAGGAVRLLRRAEVHSRPTAT